METGPSVVLIVEMAATDQRDRLFHALAQLTVTAGTFFGGYHRALVNSIDEYRLAVVGTFNAEQRDRCRGDIIREARRMAEAEWPTASNGVGPSARNEPAGKPW